MKRESRPSKLWPLKCSVTMVDAWGFNPVKGKVIAHYPIETNILVEDARGVRYFGETWRITSAPPAEGLFDDLLGEVPEPAKPTPKYDFEELLG